MTPTDDPTIVFENASVKYRSPIESYWSFKEYALRVFTHRLQMKEYWALKDISLSISTGEFFGIIGRNGAGKSTLLKLVSRVLAPTSGKVITQGFVAPMLELGAGFHYELTGMENIYLNGALLGHSHNEIKKHISEILDFAQLGDYIDAPLRTFSSGMVARLGFAIATSWTPEILILDEILAVGDEEFRRKCFQRLRGFRQYGTTILFVSHSLDTILDLCSRVAWLDHGQLKAVGSAGEIIKAYRLDTNEKH